MKKDTSIILIILAVALVLCCCLIIILGAVYYSFTKIQTAIPTIAANFPASPGGPTPTLFQITRQPVDQIPTETLKLLEGIVVPDNDRVDWGNPFELGNARGQIRGIAIGEKQCAGEWPALVAFGQRAERGADG